MKYKLNEANIDAVCKEANAFLTKRNTEPRDRTHTKLSIEEVLLDYMDIFGSDAEFTVDYGGGLSKSRIRLTVPGKPVDPFSLNESASEDENLLADVLSRMGQRLVNFGVPFGQILYKPGAAVLFWFAAICVAESSCIGTSTVWFVNAAMICIILSVAAPPVPGGMTASFTILFTQLALPVSDLAVILSLTSILDFAVTAANIYSGQCVLALTSRSIEKT